MLFLMKLFTLQDSVLLAESSHYTYVYDDRETSLVIHNAQHEDLGVYTCTARNLAGSVSCKAELTVNTSELNIFIKDGLDNVLCGTIDYINRKKILYINLKYSSPCVET